MPPRERAIEYVPPVYPARYIGFKMPNDPVRPGRSTKRRLPSFIKPPPRAPGHSGHVVYSPSSPDSRTTGLSANSEAVSAASNQTPTTRFNFEISISQHDSSQESLRTNLTIVPRVEPWIESDVEVEKQQDLFPSVAEISRPLSSRSVSSSCSFPKPPSSRTSRQVRRIVEPHSSGPLSLIQRFDLKWFGATMGTGVVSILLFTFSQLYPAAQDPLRVASYVFYSANVALFAAISFVTMLRYLLYPRLFVFMMLDPGRSMYVGTVPMGFATIVTMTVNVCVRQFGGSTWPIVAWAMWWFDVFLSVGTAWIAPFLLMTVHRDLRDLSGMTAGWLLPIVAPIVAAATGSAVADVLEPPQALVTIIVSYILLGLGLPTAIMIFAVYFHRLTMHKLPPLQHMASTFLPLGPLGQGGFAAQKLGAQAMRVFPLTNSLPLAGSTLAGHTLYVLGFITAVILWGFGTLWLFFALSSVSSRKFPFGLGWWAFTFPLGVYALSTISLGEESPSVVFRVLGTVFGSAVMVMWAVVWLMVMAKIASGKIFDVFKAPELFGTHNVR